MISRSEANDLVSKWASEGTRLRVDFRSVDTNFSVEGSMELAAEDIFRVRLRDAGFIEFHLDSFWGLEYFDPNSTHVPLDRRISHNHAGEVQETAAGIVGWSKPERYLFILEIVG